MSKKKSKKLSKARGKSLDGPQKASKASSVEKLSTSLNEVLSSKTPPTRDKAASLIRTALTHYQTGEEVDRLIDEILKTEKDTFDTLHMLGTKEGERGNSALAEELIREAIRIKETSPQIFLNLGLLLMKQSKLEEAIGSFRKAIALQPGFAMAHYNLGNVLYQNRNYPEAIESYWKTLELKPDLVEAHFNLGLVFQDLGRMSEAIDSYRRAIGLRPDYAEAYCNLGCALQGLGQLPEAITYFLKALEMKPDSANSHNNLGNALQEQGRLSEAIERYQRALDLDPEFALAYRNYTTCRKFTVEDTALADHLEAILGKTDKEEDKCNLHYALGKIYDDYGSIDQAFRHYALGNQLEREKYPYDWRGFSSSVDRLIAAFPSGYYHNRNWAWSPSDLPIFILGMPRSGTTLIEQIISSHPMVYGAGELKYIEEIVLDLKVQQGLTYPEGLALLKSDDFKKIADSYLDQLKGFSKDTLHVTDKMPGNFLHLGLISLLFPKVKVIHCQRNPLDTCLSIFFHRFAGRHPYSCDLRDLGHYYLDYERLMAHWRAVLPEGMMLEMHYEKVLENPEEMSRMILAFCGLEWDERCLNFHENRRTVRTASSWQVRQPLYKTSKERWKKYEKHLLPLQRVLAGEED